MIAGLFSYMFFFSTVDMGHSPLVLLQVHLAVLVV